MKIESDSDSNSDFDYTSSAVQAAQETPKLTSLDSLPEQSKKAYQRTYNQFLEWIGDQDSSTFSEKILMSYFDNLAKKFKSSTLWAQYSMLRTTLSINNNIDIGKYFKLKAFLKGLSSGYRPKKSKIFTSNDIDKFIKEAPDEIYLAIKVTLILGIMGACRRHELYQMKVSNFTDLGSGVLVTLPDTKTKTIRNFIVTGRYYEIYKQYANLRPHNVNEPWFFINYQKGKCTVQRTGLNKMGAMGKDIAKYLKLPDPELYTGHCFRRSSATILVDGDGDITTLKHAGALTSTAVTDGCVDETKEIKFKVADKVAKAVGNISIPSTSGIENIQISNCHFEKNIGTPINTHQESRRSPKIIFNNCTFNLS